MVPMAVAAAVADISMVVVQVEMVVVDGVMLETLLVLVHR
jgi:hypothetical protein